MVVLAAPAGAATGAITDPTGDVQDGDTGASSSDARLDITGVQLVNELSRVEVHVQVAQMVPFTDPAWSNDLFLDVALHDSTAVGDAGYVDWSVGVENGAPVAILATGDRSCVTGVTETASEYVLTADIPCVRHLPRSLEYAAIMESTGGTAFVYDAAPGIEDYAPAVVFGHGVVDRLAGTDRILTAIALSKAAHRDGSAGAVVLASARNYPDALAGGPLASAEDGPVLLTGATGLDPRTKAEIDRVLPAGGDVFVLGGTAALSNQVMSDVTAAGYQATRVAGADRFATAVAIADQVDVAASGHDTVLIADGRTFPDALIAGAVAPSVFGVVVLTDGTKMPAATSQYLGRDRADHVAIGSAAAAAATGVRNIVGTDPADLSVKVANDMAPPSAIVAVASDASFPDALAGGPLIANFGAPLLLTDPATLSKPVADAITAASGSLRGVVLFGGTAAVSTNVASSIAAILNRA